jgi:dTDP-4-dehydrorhamnose 3,5-epimerase-like enzyme
VNEVRFHQDDRAIRYCDIFPIEKGDINVSVIPPHRLVAWHRHQKQNDYWFVVKGMLKVGLADDEGNVTWKYLSDCCPEVLEIPKNIWHGYMSLEEETILIYWITNKYDPSDEERTTIEELGHDWEVPIK